MVLMDITTPTLTLKHMIFPRFLAVIRPQLLELMEPNANFAGIVHIKRNRSLLEMGLTDRFFRGVLTALLGSHVSVYLSFISFCLKAKEMN